MRTSSSRSGTGKWMLASLVILCILSYCAGLSGTFLFDDYPNIVNNPALSALKHSPPDWLSIAFSTSGGGSRRPLSMLSFGVNALFFGMHPLGFKLVNLAIHLLNGLLVFAVGRHVAKRLLGHAETGPAISSESLALLATGLWLLHPLNVSGVLYVVQRMNELSATFMLTGLLCYVTGRERMLAGESGLKRAFLGVIGFGLLAVLSKENGVLIVAYALVIELTCYRFTASTSLETKSLKGFFYLTVGLPVALFLVYLVIHPHWLADSYSVRTFTLYQRVLSEFRILCDYLLWIFVPVPSWMGLFHDDIPTSIGLFAPWTTSLSIVILVALSAAAWRLRRRAPGFAFGIAWFLIGHSLESSILPLELVFEHRNYLPMSGLLLGTVCGLSSLAPRQRSARHLGITSAALLFGLASITALRAHTWGGSALQQAMAEIHNHPDSSRAQYEAGRAIVIDGALMGRRRQAELAALPYFARAASLDKQQIYPVTNLVLIQAKYGKVPESQIDDLADRLKHTPNYVQGNPFLDMLVNASQQRLSITTYDMSKLVNAALSNPHFIAPVRAMILNNYGAYLFNVTQDRQAAITATLAAAEQDPKNPYFQLNLAKMALVLGQRDQASQHLAQAKKLDQAGTYRQAIHDIEKQLGSTTN